MVMEDIMVQQYVHITHISLDEKSPPCNLDCDIIRLKSFICLSIRGIRWD